jgi:hypothetical protein
VSVNTSILNRFFTQRVIGDLVASGTNEVDEAVVRRYINDPESKNHGEIQLSKGFSDFLPIREGKFRQHAENNIIEALYRQVGKLSLQFEWLKKM